ncbi:17812_t:CDS:2 [Entrophospora sp. SA101]|nr:6948_t:CDS:2 [Entrophospora candida]CAH1768963.1 6333_t:CDS:2 [Entrophospora sp. SA101]CAJ0640695.1 13185_t:CDS:2 [Entrophospora sp. SA101]CAJ0642954.1 927_t:CDS:2 [Entrophospora sp. SA101]CAJ0748500.1 17812_t:CDS:2 [Entrophospora sp. SA101]
MPDSLNRFNKETQEIISQWWVNNAKKNNNDNLEEVEDTYIDPLLLVIEWNDAGFQNRNFQKTNVVAIIQAFDGCQQVKPDQAYHVGNTIVSPSQSIFSVSDTRTHCKAQLAEDIVSELRELYFQRNRASLGRVYEVQATKKGVFEIREHRKVF